MAIGQIVSSFECTDKFGNTTNFYKANAGDTTKIKFNVNESIFFGSTNLLPITSNVVLTAQKILVFPNYESMNGFAVGQTVVLTKTTTAGVTTTRTTTIVSIDYNLLHIEFALLLASGNLNLYDGNNVMFIYSTSLRKSLHLNLGFLKSSATNLTNQNVSTSQGSYIGATNSFRNSLIDGTKTILFASNAGSLAVSGSTSFVQIGLQSGQFEVKNALITRNANISSVVRSFSIEFEIIQLGALLPSAFNSGDSTFIRFYNDLEWYANDEDEPTVIVTTHQNSQTGYFGSPFLLDTFDSTFDSSTGGDINISSAVTKTVTFTSASSVIAMGSFYSPQDDSYYKLSPYDQSDLCMLIEQTGALAVGIYTSKTNSSGAGYTIEIISKSYTLGVHTVTYKFTPNGAFNTFMLTRSVSDRVMNIWFKVGNINHLVYSDSLVLEPLPIEDLSTYFTSPSVFKLDKGSDTYPADLITDGLIASIGDNSFLETLVLIPRALSYLNVKIEVIVAEIADLDNFFVLESNSFDLSNYPTIDGAIVMPELTQPTTDFITQSTTAFRQVLIRRGTVPDDISNFSLTIRRPVVINWRYWINQLNAFVIFQDDRTRNWLPYQNGTYQIFVKTTFETTTNFLVHHAPIKKIYNYNEIHTDTNEEWNGTTAVEYSVESTGTVTPALIDGEIMRVKFTVDNIYAATSLTAWGQIAIEPKESSPRYVCSTNYANDVNVNNPFFPLTGETRLKQTIVSPTQSTYEILIDTNVLSASEYTIYFKYYNDTAVNEQVRTAYDVKLIPSNFFQEIDYTLQDDEDCCESTFNVFAETVLSGNSFTNDINSAWKLLLGGDSVAFELYKDDVLMETLAQSTFPNQSNARYTTCKWRDVLLDYGVGCYEIRLKYTFNATDTYTVWGRYNLQEWSNEGVQGMVRIKSIFNTNQSIDGIDFTGANVFDTLNINGFFGKRDPNMEVRNNVYSSRMSVKVVRENINTYELTTNPITRTFSRKLLDLYLISENYTDITDYNTFNHETYINKSVIVSESPTIEHFDFSNKIKIICKFEDKIKNQRSYH